MKYIGLDIGTTGCKAVLFSANGRLLKKAYREYPLISKGEGLLELNPHEIWKKVKETLQEACAGVSDIWGMSISVLGEAITPVDRQGKFLDNTVISFDSRTIPYVEWWRERIDPFLVFTKTGMPPHSMYAANKILWWKHHQPEIFNRAWKFLCWNELTAFFLSGIPAADYCMASRTMLFDAESRAWSRELHAVADLRDDILPVPVPSGEIVGTILPGIAKEIGLSPKIKFVAGGHDLICGAAGAGINQSGTAMYVTGTVDGLTARVEAGVRYREDFFRNNLCCYPHVFGGKYCTIAWNYTGGNLLRWYRDTIGSQYKAKARRLKVDPYELILAGLPEEPTRLLVQPHFTMTGTPYCDSASTGAIIGLSLDASEPEFIKALLEGVVYEMRLNIEILKKCGTDIGRVRVVGGGSVSDAWNRIKADIIGLPVETLEISDGSAAGAAMVAFIASGEGDEVEAIRRFVKVKRVYEPDQSKYEIYSEKYERYKNLYHALKKV